MKIDVRFLSGAFALATLLFVAPVFARIQPDYCSKALKPSSCRWDAYQHIVQPKYDNAWFGTKKDIEAVIARAKELFGFENTKHLGRNATMLVPATLWEMKNEINKYGNPSEWKRERMDGAHAPNAKREDNPLEMWKKSNRGDIEKYTNKDGGEVVYDARTGKIVTDEKMGTYNFEAAYNDGLLEGIRHYFLDMRTHAKVGGDQYKYVGILYERDPCNPDKYYIIDGQTGLPMLPQRVSGMPTTISDMWKGKGFMCVVDDAKDIAQPKEDAQQDKSLTEVTQSDQCDLHALDLDNTNGDWCKCKEPGCRADMDVDKGYVMFGCSVCGKVNVKYAKMALELEQRMNEAGKEGHWYGPNAEDNAHKAAGKR